MVSIFGMFNLEVPVCEFMDYILTKSCFPTK